MDTERYRLRTFLAGLTAEQVEWHDAVELADVAAVLEGNPRAVVFRETSGAGPGLAGNVNGSRARIGAAFGTGERQLLHEVLRRLSNAGRLVEVGRVDAPVQQVVETGPDADLTRLPVHLQHALDGAPYISASIDFTLDPARGWTNVGIRRLMLRGRRLAGMDLNAPSDLRAIYEAHVKSKTPLPIAFAVGAHPVDFVAASMRVPVDELLLMSRLRDAPLAVVKCITSEIRVPADAEYVIEGVVDPAGFVEAEGPYGEFLGYYGELKQNPLVRITAVTRRRDALFQTATISGRSLARTDTAQLNALRTEVVAWQALESAVREVESLYAIPAAGGAFHLRVSLRQRVPGEARNAIAAIFGCLANVKHVFVVDSDIDVFSDEQMEWALATRFQADRDLVVQSGLRAMPLDPSLAGRRTWAKAGFDLTMPWAPPGSARPIAHRIPDPPRPIAQRIPDPAQPQGAGCSSLEDALAAGPKFFGELMLALGSRDGREIVVALEEIAAAGRVMRDAEGRYCLIAAP